MHVVPLFRQTKDRLVARSQEGAFTEAWIRRFGSPEHQVDVDMHDGMKKWWLVETQETRVTPDEYIDVMMAEPSFFPLALAWAATFKEWESADPLTYNMLCVKVIAQYRTLSPRMPTAGFVRGWRRPVTPEPVEWLRARLSEVLLT